MLKVKYYFEKNYFEQIKETQKSNLLENLVSDPDGTLVFQQNDKTTRGLNINPDVFFFWLHFEILRLESSHDKCFESDFNGQAYDYYISEDRLCITEQDEVIIELETTKAEYLQELIDLKLEIRNKLISANPKVVGTKMWKACFLDLSPRQL